MTCIIFIFTTGEPFTQEEMEEMLSAAVDPDKGIIFYKDFVSMMVVDDLQLDRIAEISLNYAGLFIFMPVLHRQLKFKLLCDTKMPQLLEDTSVFFKFD